MPLPPVVPFDADGDGWTEDVILFNKHHRKPHHNHPYFNEDEQTDVTPTLPDDPNPTVDDIDDTDDSGFDQTDDTQDDSFYNNDGTDDTQTTVINDGNDEVDNTQIFGMAMQPEPEPEPVNETIEEIYKPRKVVNRGGRRKKQ